MAKTSLVVLALVLQAKAQALGGFVLSGQKGLRQIAEQRADWLEKCATESEQSHQKMIAEKQALDNERLVFERKKRELDFAERAVAEQREEVAAAYRF